MTARRRSTLLRGVEQFIYREARLRDEHRYDEWEALWTDDGVYWVPANGDDTDPTTQMSILFDNRPRIATRVSSCTPASATPNRRRRGCAGCLQRRAPRSGRRRTRQMASRRRGQLLVVDVHASACAAPVGRPQRPTAPRPRRSARPCAQGRPPRRQRSGDPRRWRSCCEPRSVSRVRRVQRVPHDRDVRRDQPVDLSRPAPRTSWWNPRSAIHINHAAVSAGCNVGSTNPSRWPSRMSLAQSGDVRPIIASTSSRTTGRSSRCRTRRPSTSCAAGSCARSGRARLRRRRGSGRRSDSTNRRRPLRSQR